MSVRPLDSPLLGLKPPWDEGSRPALGRGTLPPSPRPLERWARGDPPDIPAPLPGASLGPRTGSGELPADSWRTVGLVGAVYDTDSGPHAANGDSVWLEAGTPAAAGQPAPDSGLGRGHRTSRGLFRRGEPSWVGNGGGLARPREPGVAVPGCCPGSQRPGSRAADAPASDPPGDPAARRPGGGGALPHMPTVLGASGCINATPPHPVCSQRDPRQLPHGSRTIRGVPTQGGTGHTGPSR